MYFINMTNRFTELQPGRAKPPAIPESPMSDWPFKTLDRQLVAQLYDDYHEGVYILDSQGKIVYYNRVMAQVDGQTQFEVAGRHFMDIYNLNEMNSVSLACLTNQAPIKRCVYYRTRLGTLVNAHCNSYPFFEDGKLAGAVCFSLDFNLASTALEELTRGYVPQGDDQTKGPDHTLDAPHSFDHLVGRSEVFQKAVEKAKVAAKHKMAIMLVGETGSGKELFAQAIHNHKPGPSRRFLAVNCPAIPENLLESLLFGTTKGSFTGAMDKAGLFEAAGGGTIFLDEINSMSMELQSKLLRVLQEKKVSRVGSTKEVTVDCQIISATSSNPYSEMSAQRLRQDLFYRLGAVLIYIPPLRDREGDIGILCDHFIAKHRPHLSSRTKGLSPETLPWLEKKPWPGNVRELEHAVASAMLFAKDEPFLKIENFSALEHPDTVPEDQAIRPAQPARPEPPSPAPPAQPWAPPVSHQEMRREQEEMERERIAATLEKTGGHKAAAAAILGISPQLLHAKLKKYGLTSPQPRSSTEDRERIIRALEKTGGHKSAAAALLGVSRQYLYSRLKRYGLHKADS